MGYELLYHALQRAKLARDFSERLHFTFLLAFVGFEMIITDSFRLRSFPSSCSFPTRAR